MPYIEGYLEQFSLAQGQTLRLHASKDVPEGCALSIIREGAPEEVVHHVAKIDVGDHRVPTFADEAWEHGPKWPVCWEWQIPADLPSGAYRIELSAYSHGNWWNDPQHRDYTGWSSRKLTHPMLLIVRPTRPAVKSKILLQLCTNTYAAYNPWGGRSTYSYNSLNKTQAARVTLQRPGMGYLGGTGFANWERPFVQWCDANGIALDYAGNEDLTAWHKGYDDYRLILSVGHDEYWSAGMRDNLERFIARGGNAAFFSGNSVCWQVRHEDAGQTMVTYKEKYKDDPIYKTGDHRTLSTLWSHPLVARPENRLTGVGFPMGGYHRSHGAYMDGSGAFTVCRDDHWSLEGTGLKKGDTFGGADTIVGYECDGCETVLQNGAPVPTGKDGTPSSFVVLAQAPALWTGMEGPGLDVFQEAKVSKDGRATMGVYTTPAGGTVFTAGTTDWAHGLARDEVVQRITKNLLTRLAK